MGDSLTMRNIMCGIPQGSVLGPALWNVIYEELLETIMPLGVQLVAFANDVAVVGIAQTGVLAVELLNPALHIVETRMRKNGLQLAL